MYALAHKDQWWPHVCFEARTLTHNLLLLAQGTDSEEATAKRLFSFFDEDDSGAIDKQEMLEKLEMVGFDASGIDQLFVSISGSPQQVRGT